ncbi:MULTISPECIES: hypothetical protein [Staphylococcus]|uniref:Serine protease n=1 Tax=Staphylococcus hsinchuensis TaxID=3051183 RepID=A0ABZ3EF13_9STAP|nr:MULTISPECIES: hypothetical protein [unclassified Staphylococcus]
MKKNFIKSIITVSVATFFIGSVGGTVEAAQQDSKSVNSTSSSILNTSSSSNINQEGSKLETV